MILPILQSNDQDIDSFEQLFNELVKSHPPSIIKKEGSKTHDLLNNFLLQTSYFSLREIKLMRSSLAAMIQARLAKARTFIP